MLFRGARAVAYQAAGHRKFTKAEDAGKAWRSANAARCSLREKKNESAPITRPPTWSLVASANAASSSESALARSNSI
jgi:hypothetical protein